MNMTNGSCLLLFHGRLSVWPANVRFGFGLMMRYLVQPWVICHGNLKTLIPSSTTQAAQKKSVALTVRWFENRDTAMEVVVITL